MKQKLLHLAVVLAADLKQFVDAIGSEQSWKELLEVGFEELGVDLA